MMGRMEKVTDPLKMAILGISMLDFWSVPDSPDTINLELLTYPKAPPSLQGLPSQLSSPHVVPEAWQNKPNSPQKPAIDVD